MEKHELQKRLETYGQGHLLRFWDDLTEQRRRSLAGQIAGVDFALVDRLFRRRGQEGSIRALAARAGPPPGYRLGDPRNRVAPDRARRRGIEALRAGQVGAILVAGGQGSRLGFEEPKGLYPIGPVSKHSLLQIHLEKLLALRQQYGRPVPLALMTSPATHARTVEFLEENGRFGLSEGDLYVFCQSTMPAVDATDGKLLLAEPHRLALSPDGHGGMLAAISASGVLDQLADRGIRTLFYFQVDNPLVDVGNPEFLGYHLLEPSELSTQVIRKREPGERVGNVVAVDGRLHVIEYSDLPEDVGRRRNPDGSLALWAGSIAVHGMNVSFLQRMAGKTDALPFHLAYKKVACVDDRGRLVRPERPNAIKFERFIFDLLPSAAGAIVVEVDAAEHFAPLKNAPGQPEDTPEAVRGRMTALHRRRLRGAGVSVADGVAVEISPLFALDEEQLADRVPAGSVVTEPTFYGPEGAVRPDRLEA